MNLLVMDMLVIVVVIVVVFVLMALKQMRLEAHMSNRPISASALATFITTRHGFGRQRGFPVESEEVDYNLPISMTDEGNEDQAAQ